MKDQVINETEVLAETEAKVQKKKTTKQNGCAVEKDADDTNEVPKEKKSKKSEKKVNVLLIAGNGVNPNSTEENGQKEKKVKKRKACDDEKEPSIEKVTEDSSSQKKKKLKKEIENVEPKVDDVEMVEANGTKLENGKGDKKKKKSHEAINGTAVDQDEMEPSETSKGSKGKKNTKKTELANGSNPVANADLVAEVPCEKKTKKAKASQKQEATEASESSLKEEKKLSKTDDINENHKEEETVAEPGAFCNFRISPRIVELLKAKGITALFPVQISSFDIIYDGFDVIVQARTGSGKTLSFALPLIEKLMQKNLSKAARRPPQVLVMAPTRELAKQVADAFSDVAGSLSVLCVYGGTPIGPQDRDIRSGVDILIGTPGRIQDLINRGTLDLSQLSHVVLDEVDRMLDMGFADSVDEILQQRYTEGDCESNPQTLLFSATLPHWIHQTASKYLRSDRQHVDLVGDDKMKTSKTVQHLAIRCSYYDRASTIGAVLQVYSGSQGRAMVFCETKRDADELALSQDIKQETHVIHGDVPQEKREMVLKGFRDGRYRCLIATDVAARGLDIPEVDLVIQCNPPKDVESYIHRSGRTGRAGREGTCVLFYKPNEEYGVYDVERRAGIKFKKVGPPTPSDIINASAQDAARSLASISAQTAKHFKPLAESLLKEHDTINLIAAALALISGNTDLKPRSLLSSREGFTAFLFRTNSEMRQLGYAWRALERCISHELKEKITRMCFCADKKGCVFDVPSENEQEIEENWQDGKFDTLIKATELPELAPQDFPSDRRSSGGSGGFSGRGNNSFRGRNGQCRNFGNNGRFGSASNYRN